MLVQVTGPCVPAKGYMTARAGGDRGPIALGRMPRAGTLLANHTHLPPVSDQPQEGTAPPATQPASGSSHTPKPELVRRAAAELDSIHHYVLDGLRESQPLVVLTSLSLVIAAFATNVSQTAFTDSVAASVAFLGALLLSVLSPPGKAKSYLGPQDEMVSVARIQVSAAALVSMAAGFFLLYLTMSEFASKYALTNEVFTLVGTIYLFAIYVGLTALAWDWSLLAKRSSFVSARRRNMMAAAAWVMTALTVVIVLNSVPRYLPSFLPSSVALLLIAVFLGIWFFVLRERRLVARQPSPGRASLGEGPKKV